MSWRTERAPVALLLSVAMVALGTALQISNQRHRPVAMLLLTLALAALLLALVIPEPRDAPLARRIARAAVLALGAGLVWQLMLHAAYAPGLLGRPGRPGSVLFVVGIAAAALVAVAELAGLVWLARLRLPLLLTVYCVLGSWIIHTSPNPAIDVYAFHVEAFQALGRGVNPYAITMPEIYGHTALYGPGLVVDGRVQVGFVYPPLSLLLAGAGHLLTGDYRFANLAAMGGAALLMGTCRPGSVVAAALVLFTPRAFFVLEQGWTDPYVVLLLAFTVWCASRRSALLPLALGLLFAVKQYTLLAAPLVVLLHPGPTPWRDTARTLLKAALVAAVVTLPFAALDPKAFVHDLVWFQVRQPFRSDALSYLAWWAGTTGQQPPAWVGFALVPPTIAALLACAPRTPGGFAFAVALTFLVFFAFGKQAFANYYFGVIGALGCALAAGARVTPRAGSP